MPVTKFGHKFGHINSCSFRDFDILTVYDRNFDKQNVSISKFKILLNKIKQFAQENNFTNLYFNEINLLRFDLTKILNIISASFTENFWHISICIDNSNICDVNYFDFSKSTYTRPFVKCEIAQRNTLALLDCGAQVNLISHEYLEKHNIEYSRNTNVHFVKGVSGSTVKVLGTLDTYISFNSLNLPANLYVVKDCSLTVPVLLGIQFLGMYKFHISFHTEEIFCGQQKLKWVKPDSFMYIDDEILNLKLGTDIEIPARMSFPVIFDMQINPDINNYEILSIVNDLHKFNCKVANQDLNAMYSFNDNHKLFLEIRNNSHSNKIIPKNTKIACIRLVKTVPALCQFSPRISSFDVKENINFSHVEDNSIDFSKIFDNIHSETHLDEFKSVLRNNSSVFAKDEFDVGRVVDFEHRIDLKDDQPVACRPFIVPHKKTQIIDEEISRLLKCGIIKNSRSSFAAPCLLVYKKNGKARLVIDFRKINKKIVPVQYPLPHLETSLQLLGGNKYFSTLDLLSGYHQIPLRSQDTYKSAFTTGRGLYEFLRVPFGMISSGAAMQNCMERVLSGLNNRIVLCYVDDLIVWGKTEQEHDRNLDTVLTRLRENGFKLNLEKCHFRKTEIECLGHTISKDGIKPNVEKVQALVDKPYPKTVKQIKSFLGLTGYYRKFIQNYALIAKPLIALLKKDVKFNFDSNCKSAYHTLIDYIVNAPILKYPDFSKRFYVDTDASLDAIGAVLTQKYDNVHMPIAFYSRSLNDCEKKYPIYDLEGLAIKAALNKWKFYLLGYDVTVRTDNKPVLYLLKSNPCEGRIAKYLAAIMEFNVQFEYLQGKINYAADFLSRNVNVLTRQMSKADPYDITVINNVIKQQHADEYIKKRLDNISNYNKFCKIDNVLYFVDDSNIKRLVVPKTLVKVYVEHFHCNIGAHEGVRRTINRIKKHLFWCNMSSDIKKILGKCFICKRGKPDHNPKNVMGKFPTPTMPFQRLHIDILGPLPVSKSKFKYLLVIIDAFSHYTVIEPIRFKTSDTVCSIVQNKILNQFQKPNLIVCDQGTEFTASQFQNFCKSNDIEIFYCSPYHHASNSMVERVNLTIENALRCLLLDKKGSWESHINYINESLNTTIHNSTGFSPFEILNNSYCKVDLPGILIQTCNVKNDKCDLFNIVYSNLEKNNYKMRNTYDKNKRDRKFKLGDYVFVKVQDKKSKLKPLYCGPCKIIEVGRTNLSYHVLDEATGISYDVHINNIKT